MTPEQIEIRNALRELCTHLIDYGSIKVGTPESAKLIATARKAGAWQNLNRKRENA